MPRQINGDELVADSLEEAMTPDEVLAELNKLADLRVLTFVLPTDPLGEQWVLGLPDTGLAKLTQRDAVAFIMGASLVATAVAQRAGIKL